MYGISNSQQQGGGGGGGAASYKAIKSSIAPSDWQEVAGAAPYFVGDDATTWAIDSQTNLPTKINSSDIGIIAGQQYTITIKANGVEYSSTATATDNGGMLTLQFQFPEAAAAFILMYDHVNWATKTVGDGSAMMVNTGQNTSLVITKFEGEGFGTTIQATISDSAIKVNSAVTLYIDTSEKIAVGEKTNGNVTLIAPSIPETAIPYSLEIVGTDTEGLFELINGYVPEIPDTPSGVPQWHTIFERETSVVTAEIGTNMIQPGQLYRITLDFGNSSPDIFTATATDDHHISFFHADITTPNPYVIVSILRLEYTSNGGNTVRLSPCAYYEVTAEGIRNFDAWDNTSSVEWKFTKLEVYR